MMKIPWGVGKTTDRLHDDRWEDSVAAGSNISGKCPS